jgi:DNA-cytosine methyltransferase
MRLRERVRSMVEALLKDHFVNRFLPRARSVDELGSLWARKLRRDGNTEPLPPRTRAWVRPSRERFVPYSRAEVSAGGANGRFSVGSLFAGAGGSSMGYQLAGGQVRFAVEFGPNACASYRRNNPSTRVEQRNIRDILSEDGGVERLLARCCLRPGELDFLDASPPCTEFSLAGAGIGDQTVPKFHSGVEQTGVATLPFAYAKFVHLAQPKVSVMENVTGLAIRSPELLERIVQALRLDEGRRAYYVNWRILSAGDHGVAQARKRVIIISVRKDVAERVGIGSDEKILDLFPKPLRGMVNIRSAFEGLKQTAEDEWPYFRSIRPSQLPRLLRQLPKCPRKVQRLKNAVTNFTLSRCSWDRPAPTLTIAGQKPNGFSGAIHPELDRKFTVPELKRLFGLPDDFILTGTIEQKVECICNMVPPLLIKSVAESIYERVLEPFSGANAAD